MVSTAPEFLQIGVGAFPRANRVSATIAATALLPFVDASYRQSSMEAVVLGETLQIPRRIHFHGLPDIDLPTKNTVLTKIRCLRTRSTDGYVRQASLRLILASKEPWCVPFIVLLAGEYVVEIINDMAAALPTLDRDVYSTFVRENRKLMRLMRAKAISYWDCYYRASYPDQKDYPGLAFLRELERWAS
jgi:hypothetical protein